MFVSWINWFYFFCMARTFSNSMETVLTTIALYYWPWNSVPGELHQASKSHLNNFSTRKIAFLIAALAVVMRPTNAIIWIFLAIWHMKLLRVHDSIALIFKEVLLIG
jgi:GPI mannosyltransferase 3